MKIASIETFKVVLPFRFSFKHSLAARALSENLIVKVTTESGVSGFGECVPRDYVTGESLEKAAENIHRIYAPVVSRVNFDDGLSMSNRLELLFDEFKIGEQKQGASWCALELALLDAMAKERKQTCVELLGTPRQARIRYGGVVPFGGKKALLVVLWFYKLYGYETVKIKVGIDPVSDLERVRLARSVMGANAIIRVDANCAWDAAQTIAAAKAFRPYRVASIEQPVPADDYAGLRTIIDTIDDEILVDESLCTEQQAKELAFGKLCRAFNIRLSKVGGLIGGGRMVSIARQANLRCHMGAQVGETGILSAAGRTFGIMFEKFENYEGSANSFLLKRDITAENLTAGRGGWGDLTYYRAQPYGWGVTVDESKLIPVGDTVTAPLVAR